MNERLVNWVGLVILGSNAGGNSVYRVAISKSDGFTTIHSPLLISIGKLLMITMDTVMDESRNGWMKRMDESRDWDGWTCILSLYES